MGSAFQTSLKGSQDAFVAQVSSAGVLSAFTYLGGTNSRDEGKAIAIDTAKNIYVTGLTDSLDFPLKNAITGGTTLNGSTDAFVTELNSAGTAEVFSTYYGGSGSENLDPSTHGGAIAANPAGTNIFVTGTTDSSSGLPMKSAAQGSFGGGTGDAFAAKFTP
jgi:Beta-propeller repeat